MKEIEAKTPPDGSDRVERSGRAQPSRPLTLQEAAAYLGLMTLPDLIGWTSGDISEVTTLSLTDVVHKVSNITGSRK